MEGGWYNSMDSLLEKLVNNIDDSNIIRHSRRIVQKCFIEMTNNKQCVYWQCC